MFLSTIGFRMSSGSTGSGLADFKELPALLLRFLESGSLIVFFFPCLMFQFKIIIQ